MIDEPDVLVIGGGLAGLAAAHHLEGAGADWALLEAGEAPGGRVRTDHLDGFALDRGFQALLTAYPEARAMLDYSALDLHAFEPGALVWTQDRLSRVSDPVRDPRSALATLRAPVGSPVDKLRVVALRRAVRREDPFEVPESTTAQDLEALGFSPRMVERFWRPFLAGVLLDPQLGTSNRMFRFVLRMFAEGDTALPAGGMQAIPDQLASALPAERVHYGTAVAALTGRGVTLSDGDRLRANRAVIVATDGPGAAHLLDDVKDPGSRATTTVYLAAEKPPVERRSLVVDGQSSGPVNHLCVPSEIAPGYAPEGAALVSASVLDDRGLPDEALLDAVRTQLQGWFGPGVRAWRHLRTYRVAHAQPDQSPPALAQPQREVRMGGGRYVCGDHRDNASIQGALVSGRRSASAVLADLDT